MKAICYGNFILRFTIMVFIIQMVLCPQSSYLYSLWYSAQVLYIIFIIILSIFYIFYSAQVRLHPSNIHYSGCVHSLVETISSRLKLVRSFLFKECTKQNDFSLTLYQLFHLPLLQICALAGILVVLQVLGLFISIKLRQILLLDL